MWVFPIFCLVLIIIQYFGSGHFLGLTSWGISLSSISTLLMKSIINGINIVTTSSIMVLARDLVLHFVRFPWISLGFRLISLQSPSLSLSLSSYFAKIAKRMWSRFLPRAYSEKVGCAPGKLKLARDAAAKDAAPKCPHAGAGNEAKGGSASGCVAKESVGVLPSQEGAPSKQ